MLRSCAGSNEQVLSQYIGGGSKALRHDQPTNTPPGHTKIFRKTVDDKILFTEGNSCRQVTHGPALFPRAGEVQSMVNLINQQVDTAPLRPVAKLLQGSRFNDRACWIGGRSQPQTFDTIGVDGIQLTD